MNHWFSKLRAFTRESLSTNGEDFILTRLMSERAEESVTRQIVKDEDYVAIRIRTSRIGEIRRWTTTFCGSIHSRVTYIHEDKGFVEFNKVIVPEKMRELDSRNTDRIVQVNKSIFGPIPYRGDLSLQIGLFSVKGTDLAAPYLEFLSTVAEKAGVSSVNAALSFVDPLRRGMELLFGNHEQVSLEIGVDVDWAELETGSWLAMRAKKGSLDLGTLMIDSDDGKLIEKGGAPFKSCPYMIFSVEASRRRDDWMTIPDVKSAWDEIIKAIRLGQMNDAEQLVRQFTLIVNTSPDLVPDDAKRLVARAHARFALIMHDTAMAYDPEEHQNLPDLADLDLYDDIASAP